MPVMGMPRSSASFFRVSIFLSEWTFSITFTPEDVFFTSMKPDASRSNVSVTAASFCEYSFLSF